MRDGKHRAVALGILFPNDVRTIEFTEGNNITWDKKDVVNSLEENNIFLRQVSELQITPQQKQQAQQLYSQYLNTIFPDSKVKDIVYHGSRNKEKVLEEGFKPRIKDDLIYFNYKNISAFIKKDKSNLITAIVNLKNPIDNEAEFSVFWRRKKC